MDGKCSNKYKLLKPSLLLHAFQQNWEKKTAYYYFFNQKGFLSSFLHSLFSSFLLSCLDAEKGLGFQAPGLHGQVLGSCSEPDWLMASLQERSSLASPGAYSLSWSERGQKPFAASLAVV